MKSIGLTLKEARVAREMSIEDVANITRISRSIIEALEADDKAGLPADVYVRGFTRNIAQVLGLDPQSLVQNRPSPEPEQAPMISESDREGQRFAMLFGVSPSDGPVLGRTHLLMAMIALGMVLSAWMLVGDQSPSQESARELQKGVPAIQEHVDAVTPFTAQGLRADARR